MPVIQLQTTMTIPAGDPEALATETIPARIQQLSRRKDEMVVEIEYINHALSSLNAKLKAARQAVADKGQEEVNPQKSTNESMESYLVKLEHDYKEKLHRIQEMQVERQRERLERANRFKQARERQGRKAWKESAIRYEGGSTVEDQPRWLQPVAAKIASHKIFSMDAKHLLVFHKGTDVCIFYKPYTSDKVEPQFIAGFFSAIESFGNYIEPGGALKLIQFQTFDVLFDETAACKYCVLHDGTVSPDLIMALRDFTSVFEARFKEHIDTFKGDISVFGIEPASP